MLSGACTTRPLLAACTNCTKPGTTRCVMSCRCLTSKPACCKWPSSCDTGPWFSTGTCARKARALLMQAAAAQDSWLGSHTASTKARRPCRHWYVPACVRVCWGLGWVGGWEVRVWDMQKNKCVTTQHRASTKHVYALLMCGDLLWVLMMTCKRALQGILQHKSPCITTQSHHSYWATNLWSQHPCRLLEESSPRVEMVCTVNGQDSIQAGLWQ